MVPIRKFLFSLSCLLMACAPAQVAVEPPAVESPAVQPTFTSQPFGDEGDAGAIAYVQDNALYLQNSGEAPLIVDSCPAESIRCQIQYLKWSPDNQHLLYYFHDDSGRGSLRLVNRQGDRQLVDEAVQFVMPGAWSPDGRSIVFLGEGTLVAATEESPIDKSVHTVWTAELGSDGQLMPAQNRGQAERLSDGCGGGGRSASQQLYENEGGTAYGYLMSVLEWTAPGVLIYTTGCDNQTVGRFDLTAGAQLPPFERAVRNLVLAGDNERWFGIGGPSWSADPADHQIVFGTAGETAVSTLPTTQPAELVFYGAVSDTLYYTTLKTIETHSDLPDGETFRFNAVSLWQLNLDGSNESLRWQGDDHAIAQLSELANGDPVFVRIENDRELYEKLKENTLTASELSAFFPRRHIVRLTADGTLHPFIYDAGNPEPTALLTLLRPQLNFDGDMGGCGNVFAYRSNAGRSEYIHLFVNAPNFKLSTTPTHIDLAQHPEDVIVQLDHFAGDVHRIDNFPYCNDVVPVATPVSTWQATSGTLTITLSTDAPTLDCSSEGYSATILLENLTLTNGELTEALNSVAMDNVQVGWCAG